MACSEGAYAARAFHYSYEPNNDSFNIIFRGRWDESAALKYLANCVLWQMDQSYRIEQAHPGEGARNDDCKLYLLMARGPVQATQLWRYKLPSKANPSGLGLRRSLAWGLLKKSRIFVYTCWYSSKPGAVSAFSKREVTMVRAKKTRKANKTPARDCVTQPSQCSYKLCA